MMRVAQRVHKRGIQRDKLTDELWKVIEDRFARAHGEKPSWLNDPDWWKEGK
jgi:hypothetical protein